VEGSTIGEKRGAGKKEGGETREGAISDEKLDKWEYIASHRCRSESTRFKKITGPIWEQGRRPVDRRRKTPKRRRENMEKNGEIAFCREIGAVLQG